MIYQVIIIALIILFTGCDKEVSRSPVESEVPQGFIHVDSTPEGFTIFQNDKNTGRLTPDSISYIEAGEYEITLKKKYFKDTVVTVILNENEKLFLDIDISANTSMYGNLSLQTVPAGANIFLNDSSLNKITPSTLQNLLPGEYQVKFSLLNHRETEIEAVVQSSQTSNYTELLRDTSEWIDYQVFNSGIQSNSLTAIALDNNSVKWIGTLDRGLIRFDEISFQNFNILNSTIPGNKINCITIDIQNRVWVGTDFGIGVYNGGSWIIYNSDNSGLTSEIIKTIKFDSGGNCWIGTTANLVKFDGSTWFVYDEPSSGDWINDIYIEAANKHWLGTKSNGIFIFENEIFTPVLQNVYDYPSKTISSIASDGLNNIWFCFLPDTAGRGGASYWNGSSFNNFLFGTPQNNINHIFIDEIDNKWFATSEGFLVLDSQNSSTIFNTFNSLISADNVGASARDQNGNVWITTFASGLNKYKPPR